MRYCEVAIGGVKDRNRIIPVGEIPNLRAQCQRENKELYRSLYFYDEEILEHMKVRATVAGFRGKFYLPDITFDIDKGDNSGEELFERTHQLVDELLGKWQIPPDTLQVFFSGRGMHVSIPDVFHFPPSNELPRSVARTLTSYFSGIDDIYTNPTRIIRVSGTVNAKTRLPKIRIRINDLIFKTYDDIVNLASTTMDTVGDGYYKFPKNTLPIPDYSAQRLDEEAVVFKQGLAVSPVTINEEHSAVVTCMQKLWSRGELKGSRHNDLLRLSSSWRRSGIPKDMVKNELKLWARSLEPYAVDAIVEDVYRKGFKWGCNDPIMEKHCDPKCVFFRGKNYLIKTHTSEDMEHAFQQFVQKDWGGKVLNLKPIFNLQEDFLCYPQEVVFLWGDTGIGKSAIAMQIAVEVRKYMTPGTKVLYAALENGMYLTFRRFIQVAHGLTKQEVVNHYAAGRNTYSSAIDHVQVVTANPDTQSLAKLFVESDAKVIIIDTLDCIIGNGDENERLTEVVKVLDDLKKRLDLIIIVIHHISKFAALNGVGLHSGKGSSTVEQKGDKVICVESVGDPKHLIRKVWSAKARDETPFECVLRFDAGNTFRMMPVENTLSTREEADGWTE
jgi:hypothetical protein